MVIATKDTHTGNLGTRDARLSRVDEVITYCPGCKAFQTLWVNNSRLVLTRKFIQRNNRIYHDCGTDKPCRLYRASGADALL